MGLNRLGIKKRDRIARATGLDLVNAVLWSHHQYWMIYITTTDHRHAWYNTRTGEWGFEDEPTHLSSCRALFPQDYESAPQGGVSS